MLRLRAPAKLNLYLRILARRPDGYHELETLFERIDLADELTFTLQSQDITVHCDDPTLTCGPENLVTKAALLLQQTAGISQGAAIHLSKRIPIAAGLGGGSSDAATVLIGLNQLWDLRLSEQRLRELASQLGSDVPFFIGQHAFAIGRGRGDRCEPLPAPLPAKKTERQAGSAAKQAGLTGTPPTLWHVLVVPKARLSTKDIYDQLDANRTSESGLRRSFPEKGQGLTQPPPSITMCLHALRNGSLGELAKGLYNELQPEAIRRCPVITQIHAHLRSSGCVGSLTSGSGPAIFGLCKDESHAQTVFQRLRAVGAPDWFVRVVRTL